MSSTKTLVFVNNEVDGSDGGGSKEKLSKFKNASTLEHVFNFLRLAFTDIKIDKAAYFLGKSFFEKHNTKFTIKSSWPYTGFKDLKAQF